jgi:hypothetical protein
VQQTTVLFACSISYTVLISDPLSHSPAVCPSVCLWLHLTLPSGYHTDLLCQLLSDAAAAADFPLTSTFFVATFQKLISILTNQEINTFQRLLYHYYQSSSSFSSHIALIRRTSGRSLSTFKTGSVLDVAQHWTETNCHVAFHALRHHAPCTETYGGLVADIHGFVNLTPYTVSG